MRTALAVLIGRAIRVLARLRGGGSAFPGKVALLIAPRFLQRAVEKLPLGVVFVSGSNGKSTTTQMLVSILRAHRRGCLHQSQRSEPPAGHRLRDPGGRTARRATAPRHRRARGRRGVRTRSRAAARAAQRAAHQRAGRPAQPLLRARSGRRDAGIVRRGRDPPPGGQRRRPQSRGPCASAVRARCRAQRVRDGPRAAGASRHGSRGATIPRSRHPRRPRSTASTRLASAHDELAVDRGRRGRSGRHASRPRASQRGGCDGRIRHGSRAARRPVRSRGRGPRRQRDARPSSAGARSSTPRRATSSNC